MIRKILIANRGVIALRIMRTCRRLGIGSMAVYSDADEKSPHAHFADEAVALGPSNGPQAYMDKERILKAAKQVNADAVHPGSGFLGADADFVARCENAGLIFIGPTSDTLRNVLRARELVTGRGISVAPDAIDPAARRIEFQIIGDRHGNVVNVFALDCSIQQEGRTLFTESPGSDPGSVFARMAEAAITLARDVGLCGAASIQFLLAPSGEFHWLGMEPFLSLQHAVTEAATGTDLVELQLEVAAGSPLRGDVHRLPSHVVGASLCADETANGHATTQTIHAWNPPHATDDSRFDSGVEEGTQVPLFDPLLAELICRDATRDGAIRKLYHALKTLWVGGVPTNQDLLIQVLESQEFRDGKVGVGFLKQHPLKTRTDEAQDVLFAAAFIMYFERSRLAQRAILPEVPPNYRNNPYRDPYRRLRVGTTDLAISWRGLQASHYVFRSGETELDGELLSIESGAISATIGGVLRKFQFREVGDEFYMHTSLGSRVVRRLPREHRQEKLPAPNVQTVRSPTRTIGEVK
jgi:propionyl-CoA carboxylase alpha chain